MLTQSTRHHNILGKRLGCAVAMVRVIRGAMARSSRGRSRGSFRTTGLGERGRGSRKDMRMRHKSPTKMLVAKRLAQTWGNNAAHYPQYPVSVDGVNYISPSYSRIH